MSTTYPTTLDTFVNPTGTSRVDLPNPLTHSGLHANENDAILAIETRIGAKGTSDGTSIDFKLSGIADSDKASSLNGNETLANKALVGAVSDILKRTEQSSAPTAPAAGKSNEYIDTNHNVIVQTPSGTLHTLESSDSLFRQGFINGNFDLWQRGFTMTLSNTGTTGSRGGYLADRFFNQIYNNGGGDDLGTVNRVAFTLGQTQVPNEPAFFQRINITSVTTVGSTSIWRTQQKIEDVRSFAGKRVTVSMWIQADTNRQMAICCAQNFGTGGSPINYVGGVTINVTTTWQRYTAVFDIPTLNGKVLGANDDNYLEFGLVYYKGDNNSYPFPSGIIGTHTTGQFDTAQWSVNIGDQVLPFMPEHRAVNLAKCQRYFEKSYSMLYYPGQGFLGGDQSFVFTTRGADQQDRVTINFKTMKRANSTPNVYSIATGTVNKWRSNSGADISAAVQAGTTTNFVTYPTTNLSNGEIYYIAWAADAEL